MVPASLNTALLVLLSFVARGDFAEEPSVKEIVENRLLTGFKDGCDAEAATMRSLGILVKAAYRDVLKREGKTVEPAEMLVMDVKETFAEDNSAYSRKLTLLSITSPSDPKEDILFRTSAADDGNTDRCLFMRLNLKKVGVSVFSFAECPIVAGHMNAAVSAFQVDECISFVERDTIVHLYPTFEGPPAPEISPDKGISAPPDYPLAYWLEVTGVDRAWAKHSCVKNVVVGVIDTGVATQHPDLQANIWKNELEIPGNGIDDDRNGYVDDIHGYDFYLKKAHVVDAHGHGTHVAGIIGAVPKTTSVQGVCKNVSIAALRFLDAQGSGATSDALEAINYAIEMDFHITNNSWGGPDVSKGMLQAIKRAAAIDQLFVAAAGNSGQNADIRPEYPGAYKVDNVISVAATDELDRLANFSNYGKGAVHIGAPGVYILSTYPPATVKSLSGTSMATPVIAGIAAMILSLRPMPVSELKQLLFTTAERPRSLKNRLVTGGRVNAAFAVCSADSGSH